MTGPDDLVTPLVWSVLRMVGALALLGLGAWAMMRWKQRAGGGRESLRVIDRTFLTRGASLALVSVAGKRLLLGISGDGVRLLTQLDPGAPDGEPPGFDHALREATSRKESGR